MLSARSEAALEAATANLLAYLEQHPDVPLADVAHTLQVGRRSLAHRRVLAARDHADAAAALAARNPKRLVTRTGERHPAGVVFMFPGQGAQYVTMARALYATEHLFRAEIDRCAELLQPHLGLDLRDVLYPADAGEETTRRINETWLTQPALFAVEYALARLWQAWGIAPEAMIGHSIGEYVAACLAGVFSLEEALALVAARGRLVQSLPGGAMLAVPLPEAEVTPLLGPEISLAAVNGPASCVVSGPTPAIDALAARLTAQGLNCRRLHTSHAFHSAMMDPIVAEFEARVAATTRRAPRIPFVSNLTGTWITAEQATDPAYWSRHLRQAVRFAAGVRTLLAEPDRVLLEVGPGRTLGTLARQADTAPDRVIVSSLRHPNDPQDDSAFLLEALGRLWLAGIEPDWAGFYANEQRRRVPLPTYPFERKRYWIAPPQAGRVPTVPAPYEFGSEPANNTQHATRNTQLEEPHERPDVPSTYVAPRSDTEQQIAAVWAELLGIAQVGVYDNFFELGGDSLLATQMLSRLRTLFQVELPPQTPFEAPTVDELALAILRHSAAQTDEALLAQLLAELEALPEGVN
jgi:acyl transferase domain-containing protein